MLAVYVRRTLALAAILPAAAAGPAAAATIWTGPTITVTKAAFADPTLESNQDRITDNVWLTRGDVQGLYNIKLESGFQNNVSPLDTEWALGDTGSAGSLAFADFQTFVLGSGSFPSIVGQDIVLHLISEDIFIDFKITSWGMANGGGGSFTYERSTVPEPTAAAILFAPALLVACGYRRRRAARK